MLAIFNILPWGITKEYGKARNKSVPQWREDVAFVSPFFIAKIVTRSDSVPYEVPA